MKVNVPDCDVVYLSYDEPNAEKNYADLLTKVLSSQDMDRLLNFLNFKISPPS